MSQAAIISVILKNPQESQSAFNAIVSEYHSTIQGRMGIPYKKGTIALISLIIVAQIDTINEFVGKVRNIENVVVNANIAEDNIN
ncbi:TM1266 family iron-only hydrogenase system putative regulator [Anaerotignum sp. MB30-C6]|uniref:TM1266 family iron-only hydrogenase system putative regulator n=1 Tax=Anaerotignum sp. MB30-C6 TaxID=3070814 RepID=UPI0027DB926F|nr:TM1266 family iron-only hydrogenase system putative regulator [Anaerotignum sp. MB30-C6]WMI79963.1 iron-only hydrogenase system regulator [Anaerotignum sp. MB30-C6]